jgi:hypothetical protein
MLEAEAPVYPLANVDGYEQFYTPPRGLKDFLIPIPLFSAPHYHPPARHACSQAHSVSCVFRHLAYSRISSISVRGTERTIKTYSVYPYQINRFRRSCPKSTFSYLAKSPRSPPSSNSKVARTSGGSKSGRRGRRRRRRDSMLSHASLDTLDSQLRFILGTNDFGIGLGPRP